MVRRINWKINSPSGNRQGVSIDIDLVFVGDQITVAPPQHRSHADESRQGLAPTGDQRAYRCLLFCLLLHLTHSGHCPVRSETGMLVCAGRTAQRRSQIKTQEWSSSDDEDGVPHGAIVQPRNRFDPRVVRSRNCTNARKAHRTFRRRKSQLIRDDERQRRAEKWERALILAQVAREVAGHNAAARALNLVSTYHKKLQYGYFTLDMKRPRTIEIQDFVCLVIAEDIITPEFTGLNIFMQQWDFFSRFHAEVNFRANRLQLFPMEGAVKTYPSLAARDRAEAVYVIKSTGVTTLSISRLTIEQIFPRILNDEELVQHLIGKTYNFNFTIYWHVSADGHIFQMESRVDLSSSLMTLLDDRDAVAKMIREAAIMPSGNLALQNEVREAQNTLANSYL